MTKPYDILVAGADEASLCAAAAAALHGARAALLAPSEIAKSACASCLAVPNFVWRRFDLHEYGLTLEPVSARVTFTNDNKTVSSYASARQSQTAFAKDKSGDYLIWESFVEEMRALGETAPFAKVMDGGVCDSAALGAIFADARSLAALERATESCTATLDDYLTDVHLKTHVAAHALGRAGLGGREAGSAIMLPEFFDEDAWPCRVAKNSPSLASVLEKVCDKNGVERLAGRLVAIGAEEGKYRAVVASDNQIINTQLVFFASPDAALAAGARPALSMRGGANATAMLRIKLKHPIAPPAGDKKSTFQIADDLGELQCARDAAADGRLPDRPPVAFEFAGPREILARTSYCPASFRDGDAARGWTGQDRQAIAARMKDRLVERIDGLAGNISKTEVRVIGGGEPGHYARIRESEHVIMQPHRHNAIAAAVILVDKALEDV